MPDLTLRFPVSTPDGRELLPESAVLSADVIREVAGSTPGPLHRTIPFLEYGSIRRDLHAYMQQDVYRHIFREQEERDRLMILMEAIRLPSPVFDILRSFRQNDIYTYRHILVVSALTCLFAQGLSKNVRETFLRTPAGPLHDLGKISVPLEILRKTAPLRRTERAWLEHHTAAGYVLLAHYLGNAETFPCAVARDHHERRDGSKYPRRIRLDDPLVEIVVVCDVYDALLSPRPYRSTSFDNRTAIEEITGMAEEGKIGWDVVRFLVSRNRAKRPAMEECTLSLTKRGKPPEGNMYGVVVDNDAPTGRMS